MKRTSGFTLIEAMIVVAIVGILATITIGAGRAAKRNAGLAGAVYEINARLQGQPSLALGEQRDRVVVFVDASSPSACGFFNDGACGHMWLIAPAAGWSLSDFATSPSQNAGIIDTYSFPVGVKLAATTQTAGPAPFAGVKTFDGDLTSTCGGAACIAIRYGSNGQVSPVFNSSTRPLKTGVGLVLASDLDGQTIAAARYRVVVGVPTGIVKYSSP